MSQDDAGRMLATGGWELFMSMLAPRRTTSRVSEMLLGQVRSYADKLDQPITGQSRIVTGRTLRVRKDRLKKLRAAARLRRLEDVLGVGNWLYEAVRLVEGNWRTEVIYGKTLYDPDEEASIMDFFREWSAPCDRCLREIDRISAKPSRIAGANRFKDNCTEARRVLAGQSPFFDDASNAARWTRVTAFLHPSPCPVIVDDGGRIIEMTGEQLNIPGLEPTKVLKALDDERAGRLHSFDEVVASLNQHEI
jgi:hypothetical protein